MTTEKTLQQLKDEVWNIFNWQTIINKTYKIIKHPQSDSLALEDLSTWDLFLLWGLLYVLNIKYNIDISMKLTIDNIETFYKWTTSAYYQPCFEDNMFEDEDEWDPIEEYDYISRADENDLYIWGYHMNWILTPHVGKEISMQILFYNNND